MTYVLRPRNDRLQPQKLHPLSWWFVLDHINPQFLLSLSKNRRPDLGRNLRSQHGFVASRGAVRELGRTVSGVRDPLTSVIDSGWLTGVSTSAAKQGERSRVVMNDGVEERFATIGLPKEQYASVQASKAELTPFHRDEHGRFAWDRWEQRARAAGIGKDLAGLGRAVMREAIQHDWPPELKAECGWGDDGERLLVFAQQEPAAAEERWGFLLETDGERGRLNPKTESWEALR